MSCDIVFVHSALKLGGAEVLRRTILSELNKRDVSVRVCLFRDLGSVAQEVRNLGVPVDVLGVSGRLWNFQATMALQKYLEQYQPSIVQGGQFLTNMHTTRAGRAAKVPLVIIEEHGLYTWKRWYHRLVDRYVCSRANGAVACSEAVADFANGSLQMPSERVRAIPNCIDEQFFPTRETDVPTNVHSLIGRDTSFAVGIVGTLRWEKGHATLLKAWRLMLQQQTIPDDSALLIVGDGPLKQGLKQEATGLSGVHFLGSHSDVRDILQCLDLFVLPSHNEGFGIAIAEAMACGVPVIATKTGGIPEVVDHGQTGILVPVGNPADLAEAISSLWRDVPLREALATAGQQRAFAQFRSRVYVDRLLSFYRDLFRMEKRPIPEWCEQTS